MAKKLTDDQQQEEQLYHRERPATVAPGLEDDELQAPATKAEVESGDSTEVTVLSWDENDNGTREE